MKSWMGYAASAALLAAGAVPAEAQVLVPMRDAPVVVREAPDGMRASDLEWSGRYDGGPDGRVYARPHDGYAEGVLPPREVNAILREAGYSPLGAPQQRGPVYTVAAVDRRGEDGRMVVDARTGRILRFTPAYRMGERMTDEVAPRRGPETPELPQYRRPPFEAGTQASVPMDAAPRAVAPPPKVASRSSAVPLPKAPPARAVATPAGAVAVDKTAVTRPIAGKPAEPSAVPAPVQQSGVQQPDGRQAPVQQPAAQPPAVQQSAVQQPAVSETKPATAAGTPTTAPGVAAPAAPEAAPAATPASAPAAVPAASAAPAAPTPGAAPTEADAKPAEPSKPAVVPGVE